MRDMRKINTEPLSKELTAELEKEAWVHLLPSIPPATSEAAVASTEISLHT